MGAAIQPVTAFEFDGSGLDATSAPEHLVQAPCSPRTESYCMLYSFGAHLSGLQPPPGYLFV